jgi:hypothetical protein
MWDNHLKKKVKISMQWNKLDQEIRLTYDLNERLLRDEFLEAITSYPRVVFGKTIPRWKGNSTRNMME